MNASEPGIGKKILSFFIKESTEPTASVPATEKTISPSVESSLPVVPKIADTANIDRKFVEHFVQLLEKANLPGHDYFEYKQTLLSMDGLGLGEEKQFQAAWASFKAMGGTKETTLLKSTAEHYMTVLDKDRAAFFKDVEKTIAERVGALQLENKKLEESNLAIAQEIVDLQKKMDENKSRLGKIAGEIAQQTSKINANKDGFEVTYRSFTEQIKIDLTKIDQFLQ